MLDFMLREAWRSLDANRLRSILTMLGMIIGMAAVVVMVAIGTAVQNGVNQEIQSMGSNLFIVTSGAANNGGVRDSPGTAPTLTLQDVAALGDVSGVAATAPIAAGAAQVVYRGNNWHTTIWGSTPGLLAAHDYSIQEGRMFSNAEVRTEARVAVIGQIVASNLFGDANPIGKVIRISGRPFQVIGLLAPKGQSFTGNNQDDIVLIPVSTALHELFGSEFSDSVKFAMVKAESNAIMGSVQVEMQDLLRQRHHLAGKQPDDFDIKNFTAVASTARSIAAALSMLLGTIASISLLVGGIGIMNIMLVSVTERTREIGIRLAVGARRRDILSQFLIESVMLSVAGCGIGVALAITVIVSTTMVTRYAVSVPVASVVMAFVVATGVGVFFGYYPARKASDMRPIDALRFQ